MNKLVKYEEAELRNSNKYVEYCNFVKLAAFLADFGYQCSWLSVDDSGADFICINIKDSYVFKVQIKSRITISKKYEGKDLYIAFPRVEKEYNKDWVIVSHDELIPIFTTTENYIKNGGKSSESVPKYMWERIKEISIIEPCNF
jgi:hypothetical protein